MRAITAIVGGLLACGCNQVWGLTPPELADGGGGLDASVDAACGVPEGLPDEDNDGLRDECDNCPHIAQALDNELQDLDGDGIGAACDPHPDKLDRVVAFFTFSETTQNGFSLLVDATAGSWSFVGGDLVAGGTVLDTDMMARLDVGQRAVTIDVDVTLPVTATLPKGMSRSLGVWANVQPPPPNGPYDPTYPPGVVLELVEESGVALSQRAQLLNTKSNVDTRTEGPEWFLAEARYRLVLTCEDDGECRGQVQLRKGGNPAPIELNLTGTGDRASVGLRSFGADVRFHHAMVYAPVPAP